MVQKGLVGRYVGIGGFRGRFGHGHAGIGIVFLSIDLLRMSVGPWLGKSQFIVVISPYSVTHILCPDCLDNFWRKKKIMGKVRRESSVRVPTSSSLVSSKCS